MITNLYKSEKIMRGCFHSEVAHPSFHHKERNKKMIEISAGVHQDKIIELLNNYNEDGIEFTFNEKKGSTYIFPQT